MARAGRLRRARPSRAEPSSATAGAPDAADLVRQILERVGDDAAPPARATAPRVTEAPAVSDAARLTLPPSGTEVVLDVELNGSHYVLVRRADEALQTQPTLSPRESEIVRLIAKGLPNKAVATVLDISLWTVATYVRRLFAKLGVSSRAEMVARVLEGGLLTKSG